MSTADLEWFVTHAFEGLIFRKVAVKQLVEVAVDKQFLLVKVHIEAVLSPQIPAVIRFVYFLSYLGELCL